MKAEDLEEPIRLLRDALRLLEEAKRPTLVDALRPGAELTTEGLTSVFLAPPSPTSIDCAATALALAQGPKFEHLSLEKYREIRDAFRVERDKHVRHVEREWGRIGALLDRLFREESEETAIRLVGEIGGREYALGVSCKTEGALRAAIWGPGADEDDAFSDRFIFDLPEEEGELR